MSDAVTDKDPPSTSDERARDRSPPFPFIPLEKAIERARQFEAQYKRSPGRVINVLGVWDYTPKSSGGLQTIAALKAFGLVEEEGGGADRKIKLSELAYRILKDERPGKREEAIKEAALKPKSIAEHWGLWGATRPPDPECRSELTLERGYPEEAANRFLRVYDDTISFAKLGGADSIADKEPPPSADQMFRSFIPTGKPKVPETMPERLVFAQEIEAPQAIKLLVTGPVDDAVLDALQDFVEFQRVRLKRAKASAAPPEADVRASAEPDISQE